MNLSKEKFELVRQQVAAKIHWGSGDDEVREWLGEKWAIMGETADQLLAEAHRAKRKAMRSKALQTLTISGICLVTALVYLVMQNSRAALDLGVLVILAMIVGIVSLILFISSLLHVMRGEEEGPAD